MWDSASTNELINRAQAGEKDAMDTLVRQNVPLVKSLVKKFLGRGIEYEDLLQTGTIGLIKAIDGFNPDKGVRLSTYAFPLILGELKKFVRDYRSVKIPRSVKELEQKIRYFRQKFLCEKGRDATVEEICREFSCSPEDVLVAMESNVTCSSLDEKNNDGLSVIDTLEAPEKTDFNDILALKKCLNELDARAKKVILMRFYRQKTQTEVAKMLGISQVQVSRIESRTIETLRKKMG